MLHSVYSNLLHIVAQKSIFHCIQVTVAKDLARNYVDQGKKCWRKYGVLKKICNTRSGCCCGDGGQPAIRLMQEGEWLVSAEVCSSTEYYLMFFARLKESNKKDKGGKQSWVAPPPDYYTINCDASSLCSDFKKGGWDFIARNCRGEFLEGSAGNLKS